MEGLERVGTKGWTEETACTEALRILEGSAPCNEAVGILGVITACGGGVRASVSGSLLIEIIYERINS